MLSRAMPIHCLGGMEINTLRLAKKLVKHNHEVTILTTSYPNSLNDDSVDVVEGVKIYYIGSCSPGKYSKEFGAKSVDIFMKLHKDTPFDIVHSQNSSSLYLYRRGIFKKYNLPHVITWHGTHLDWILTSICSDIAKIGRVRKGIMDTLVHIYRLLINDIWLTRSADAVIALDKEAAFKIKVQYLASRKKVYEIYTGVDIAKFYPTKNRNIRAKLGMSDDDFVLLCVGRIVYEKGFQNALVALTKLLKLFPDIKLIIVGDGPFKSELEIMTKKLNVASNVIFTGRISDEDLLLQYINSCDLFINPILHISSFNTTLAEAMACGKVVITSRTGGVSTLITNWHNGILINRGSVSDLVNAIKKIRNNPSLARMLGKNARDTIVTKFNIDMMIRKYIKLYEKLIAKRGRREVCV